VYGGSRRKEGKKLTFTLIDSLFKVETRNLGGRIVLEIRGEEILMQDTHAPCGEDEDSPQYIVV